MNNEEMERILAEQQEAIALLRAGQVQFSTDIDELRSQLLRQFERIVRIEYAVAQIQRRLDTRP